MDEMLNVFIKIDAIKSISGSGTGTEPWVFEGIASTQDMDLYDEVVYPESFTNSIEFFKSNGKIFFEHEYAKKPDTWLEKFGFTKDEILSLKTPIGKPLDARITPEGLYIKAALNKEHPMAKKMWNEFLTNPDEAFRDQIGLSIGAKYLGTPRREYDVKKGKYVTYLPDLLLYEVSMTPEPVNPYTKTWASVLKSIIETENKREESEQYHKIVPEAVLFDNANGRLIVKSVVEGGDGITHVFESYIDVKEDIRNVMAEDEKVTLKAFPPNEEEPETKAPAGEEDVAAEPVAEEAPVEESPFGGEAPVGEAPMGEAPVGGAVEGEPGMEGGGEIPAAEDAGGILDSLVAGDEGGEPGAVDDMMGGGDASMDMVLDKQDTMLDLLGQILDALHGSAMEQEAPVEEQVTQQAPSAELMKSLNPDTIKGVIREALAGEATVSLSDESTKQFGEVLKGVLEGFEDRIVEKLVLKLQTETTVIKSVGREEAKVSIRHPGVSVSGDGADEGINPDTLKSISPDTGEERNLDSNLLKKFLDDYRGIKGYDSAAIQKRARVVEGAMKSMTLSENEFRYFVRKAEKGQL